MTIVSQCLGMIGFLLLLGCNPPASIPGKRLPENINVAPGFDIRQLIGSWEGKDKFGEAMVIQFQPGETVKITRNGQSLALLVPTMGSFHYQIRQDKSPMWLDIIATDATGNEIGRVKGIFQLLNPKEMRYKADKNPIDRSEDFIESETSTVMILKKYY